jgi:hypothetical protein
MVRDCGQLYTMEGIAAGLIMLITAYLVLSSTSVYTPGDTHLTDMQLEQVGSDILRVMDTPRSLTGSLAANRTDLELFVNRSDSERVFTTTFLKDYFYNPKVMAEETNLVATAVQINATVWYRRYDGSLWNYTLATSPGGLGSYTGREPGVRVTHWLHTGYRPRQPPSLTTGEWSARMRSEPQELLVEVVMWKV